MAEEQDINIEEAPLNIWEQQAYETEEEYNIWLAFLSFYPLERPTVKKTAEKVHWKEADVRELAERNNFIARLKAYDKAMQTDWSIKARRVYMAQLNEEATLASKLRLITAEAINNIDLDTLEVKDIVALGKLSVQITHDVYPKAYMLEEAIRGSVAVDSLENVLPGADTTDRSISTGVNRVMDILRKAGALVPSEEGTLAGALGASSGAEMVSRLTGPAEDTHE